MKFKLTLTLNKDVIEKAKNKYATAQERSLSNLVESYIKWLVSREKSPFI